MKLTKNFSLSEFTKSTAAKNYDIDNTPSDTDIENIKQLCLNVLQPIRDWNNDTINITSGYRSPELNRAISGAANSQHTKGQAADFVCRDRKGAFLFIKNNMIFDQIIYEFGDDNQPSWIHVSFKESGNRRQALRAIRDINGKTKYTNYD